MAADTYNNQLIAAAEEMVEGASDGDGVGDSDVANNKLKAAAKDTAVYSPKKTLFGQNKYT